MKGEQKMSKTDGRMRWSFMWGDGISSVVSLVRPLTFRVDGDFDMESFPTPNEVALESEGGFRGEQEME